MCIRDRVRTWTQVAVDDLAGVGIVVKAGDPIDEQLLVDLGQTSIEQFCADSPAYCAIKASYAWTQLAVDELAGAGVVVKAGDPIDEQLLLDLGQSSVAAFCEESPAFCMALDSKTYGATPSSSRFSVIRTGTGDLELLSAGNLSMDSLYGVYTAGTSSTATTAGDPYNQPRALGTGATVLNDPGSYFEQFVNGSGTSLYRAWYPEAGGNLRVSAGGDLTGNISSTANDSRAWPNPKDNGQDSAEVGNWLWRQGSGDVATGGSAQPVAWWINFGTYAANGSADRMLGFTGFGTLGGGNLELNVGGDAGILQRLTDSLSLIHI